MNSASTLTGSDPTNVTAQLRARWDASAEGWNAHTPAIHGWLQPATEAMLGMAGVRSGARVLDVAAGAGDQTMTIARRVGAQGHVLAADLSPAIIALARENADREGLRHVETRAADGEDLGVPDASFDAAVCRLGLMLFPDPLKGLREMHRALRPGGGVCTMVFSSPDRNPCIAILMATATRHAGLGPRDPFAAGSLFSLAPPGRIDGLFRSAGFEEVATTTLDAPFCLPSVDHYLAFVRSSASPILEILAPLDEPAIAAAWREMRERLQVFSTPDGWRGPNELLLTAGRRAQETT